MNKYDLSYTSFIYFINLLHDELTMKKIDTLSYIDLEKITEILLKIFNEITNDETTKPRIIVFEHERGTGLSSFFDFFISYLLYFQQVDKFEILLVTKSIVRAKEMMKITNIFENIYNKGIKLTSSKPSKSDDEFVVNAKNFLKIKRQSNYEVRGMDANLVIFDNILKILNEQKFESLIQQMNNKCSIGFFEKCDNMLEIFKRMNVNYLTINFDN